MKAEVAFQKETILGEGCIWDNSSGKLWWIDILKGEINIFSPKEKTNETIHTDYLIGSIALRKKGGLIVATNKGLKAFNLQSRTFELIGNPEENIIGNRFNDGKCDANGRFWVGSMEMKGDHKKGNLYRLDTDFSIHKILTGISISNGITWSPDQKTMYYIDTPTKRVTAFDFDEENGNISNGRTGIEIPTEEGWPDGMTIDEEGMLWIAHWGGKQVGRWNPKTGRKINSIPLPVTNVTSVTFGGDTLEDLYITTASLKLTNEKLNNEPLAGALFCVPSCGVKGLPSNQFLG